MVRINKRLILYVAALLLLSLALAACSGQPAADTASESTAEEAAEETESEAETAEGEAEEAADEELPYGLKSGKPYDGTELTFLICCPTAAQFAVWADSVAEFKDMTGIDVVFTNDPLGGLREKIVTESIGNPGSWDTTIYFDTWGPSLTQFIDPIANYSDEIDTSLADYPDATRDIATIDDTLYGIPVRSHVMMLYYREDVFEELGLEVPTTWEELEAAAKTITEADNDMYGIAMNWANQGGGISLLPWTNTLRANESDIFDADYYPTFNNAEGVAATEFYQGLLEYAPQGAPTYNEGDMRTSFASGESAMAMGWSWFYEVFQNPDAAEQVVIDNTGYTAVIPGAAGGADPVAMAWPMGISSSSENKEAALEWVKWMTNADMDKQAIVVKDDPTRATVVANRLSSLSSAEAADANGGFSGVMAEAFSSATPLPVYLEFPEVSVVLEAALTEIATGSDVETVLSDAAAAG